MTSRRSVVLMVLAGGVAVIATLGGHGALVRAYHPCCIKWEMATPYNDASFYIKEFIADLRKRTHEAFEITFSNLGAVADDQAIKTAVRDNKVQIGEFLIASLGTERALLEVDAIPFLATDYREALKLWRVSRPVIEQQFQAEGVKILIAVPSAPQGLYTTMTINSVADIKDTKLAVSDPAAQKLASAIGALPVQTSVEDMLNSLAAGNVDGIIGPALVGAYSDAGKLVTHFYDIRASLPKRVLVVNQKALYELSPDFQQAIADAASRTEELSWRQSEVDVAQNLATLRGRGIEVSDPSVELRAELREIGEKLMMEWVQKVGAEGEAIARAYGQQ